MIAVKKKEKEEVKAKVETKMHMLEQSVNRLDKVFPAYETALLDRYLKCKGNIRVFIRVRPILPNDFKAYGGTPEQLKQIEGQLMIPNSQ